jgi:cold shock CspA family protein
MRGLVSWVKPREGYAEIVAADGSGEVFIVKLDDVDITLLVGQRVTFEPGPKPPLAAKRPAIGVELI